MSATTVPIVMPPRLTLSLIFSVTSPAPRMMPAAAGTRLTGLAEVDPVAHPDLRAEHGDHAVEHDRHAAEHTGRDRADEHAELRAQAEQDRGDRRRR